MNRRNFLKLMGLATSAPAVAASLPAPVPAGLNEELLMDWVLGLANTKQPETYAVCLDGLLKEVYLPGVNKVVFQHSPLSEVFRTEVTKTEQSIREYEEAVRCSTS